MNSKRTGQILFAHYKSSGKLGTTPTWITSCTHNRFQGEQQSYDTVQTGTKSWRRGIKEIKPFSALKASQVSEPFANGLLDELAAGDCGNLWGREHFGDPVGYWQLISHLDGRPAAAPGSISTPTKNSSYFAFLAAISFHANANCSWLLGDISSGDFSTQQRMIFFTNDINLRNFLKQFRLNRYYYGHSTLD
ncbi:hypothetical protein ACW185_09760 [Limosilactobacillus fermentum]